MRSCAMLAGIIWLAPLAVGAQTANLNPRSSDQALSDAVFVNHGPPVSADGAFQTPDAADEGLVGAPTARVAAAGQGLIGWRSSQVSRLVGGGAVDTIRLTTTYISRAVLPDRGYDAAAVGVRVVRGWPAAVVFGGGPVGVSVTPHAGVGIDTAGGSSAEAGATVKLSSMQAAVRERLEAMGVKDGSRTYGREGRWYLFAAVRGQAVGFNVQDYGRRTGWSTDPSSALVGDGQVGVGWRQGGIEASFGYVHRGVHIKNAPVGMSDSYADDMAALAFSWRPRW